MAIAFGNYTFSKPVPFDMWSPPCKEGLYAILVPDVSCKQPYSFRVIYLGESSNMMKRNFLRLHHKYPLWLWEAGSNRNLHIAVYPMPGSTLEERHAVKVKLVAEYRPICNQNPGHTLRLSGR